MSTASDGRIVGNSGADADSASHPYLDYRVADGIATIEICRPDKLNALLPDMILVFSDLIERARRDAALRAGVAPARGADTARGASPPPRERDQRD